MAGPHPVVITTERLTLVPLQVSDAEEMYAALADPALYQHIGGRPSSAAELARRYRWMLAGSDEPGVRWWNWVVRLSDGTGAGTVQATAGPARGRLCAVIAWIVGTPWQRKGIATEAARALVGWLHGHGVYPVTAHIHPDNVASQAVARACGLRPTARWADGELVWDESG